MAFSLTFCPGGGAFVKSCPGDRGSKSKGVRAD